MSPISSLRTALPPTLASDLAAPQQPDLNQPDLKQTFDQFVGETFYGQLLKSMRQTVGKPAYFHGGRGEEVFQGQLDQVLVEKMSEATAESFTGPMFELFQLQR